MMKKGLKTTIVASVGGILGIAVFVFWLLGEIDNSSLGIGLGGVSTLTTTLGLLLSKDFDQSHTKN